MGSDDNTRYVLAAVSSAAVIGIEAYAVTVEVDAAQGLPQWTIVGLPAGAVKESRDRVGAALVNGGFALPPRRLTVNLAPADVRKEGTAFDLPIALGVLAATGQVPADSLERRLFVGELGLDGSLRAVRGALPLAQHVATDRRIEELILPGANVAEAARVSGVKLAAPGDLAELVRWLRVGGVLPDPPSRPPSRPVAGLDLDWSDVAGQLGAKRALEIAAAGGHNVLLLGPPGSGKTMLARRVTGILPPLSESEALQIIAIASVAGTLSDDALADPRRPFRAPHHTTSAAGLIGGGSPPRPGEVSLAHHGVLFLDEMLEFPRHILDSLRQPMEDGHVVIARAASAVRFPARFSLIAATNPCPCGNAGSAHALCTCTPADARRYRGRLSGPLADRIDLQVRVPSLALGELSRKANSECSVTVRARVAAAHSAQGERYARNPRATRNAHVAGRWLDAHTPIHSEARGLLERASQRLGLSARGYHRVLKVARTIADLEREAEIGPRQIGEALQYRPGVADGMPAMPNA